MVSLSTKKKRHSIPLTEVKNLYTDDYRKFGVERERENTRHRPV